MASLIIPELILLDAYKKALKYIRNNYNAATTPEESYLYKLLGTNEIERYNFFTQSKAVFITTENDPRHIAVNLFFNAKRAGIPTIHITNPSENPIHDSLNLSSGVHDPIFNEDDQVYEDVFNRRFKARYNIVFTSDNTTEIILMYQVMKSMSISITEHLSLAGLENIKISGNEINIKSDIVPINVFIKAIAIEFEYNTMALKLSTTDFTLGDFIPNGTPIN